MRKLFLVLTMVAFFTCMAAAQTTETSKSGSSTADKTSGTDAGQSSTSGAPATSGQTGDMTKGSATAKGEKTLKGCIVSEGGQNMLEEKGGQKIALAGQDVSAHAGHEVKLHGTYESGGAASDMSKTSTGTGAAGAGKTFNVTKVDMVSENCPGAKAKTK